MRHKRIKNFIVGGALIGALLITTTVFAYNQDKTHPALTDEIVDFYNLNFSQKLSSQDKNWIVRGSMDEDQGMRPMNHFYDPVHNTGMAGFSTSKQWAMSSGAQSNLAMAKNSIAESAGLIKSADDFSYARVMDDYAHGDRQRAMIGFGHLLHLLEDMGVPDHTRNDPHPPVGTWGSPYEHEMAKWNPGNFNIASELKKEKLKLVILANLSEYFDKLAKYSNGNFFSKDTISNENYDYPKTENIKKIKLSGLERSFVVGKDKNGTEFALALVVVDPATNSVVDITLKNSFIGSYILDGYWDRLSKEVVLNGAGALNLLLTKAEKAKTEFANRPSEKLSWFARLLGLIGIKELTTPKESQSDPTGQASDGGNEVVNNSNTGDSIVTPTPKVTNPAVSPTPLVTKTPVTNVTIPTPSVSPSKTPVPKPSIMPTPKLTTSDGQRTSDVKTTGRVVINEIAWAGTEAAATDEWIELYNTENESIDISSWQLVSSDDSPDIIFPEGTVIQAKAYFLIERTDDNAISDIMTDLAVSFGQGGLNNTGEMVRLFNSAGTVVDIVGGAGEAWYFGDSVSKKSMERIDTVRAGNNASNWKNFSGMPVNKDATGNLVNGTPKTKNSTAVLVVVLTGGGGGGGSSSTPDSTSSPQATPTPSPSPEPDGDTANPGDIVINEIAWMGMAESRYCEWVELRNKTSVEINLAGWGIYKDGGVALIMSLTGKISPDGYYLIERITGSCPDPISGINDDAGMFGGGDLVNTGESLVLKDISGIVIDQVDGSNEWKLNGDDEIMGDNITKETAQRMGSGWITATSTPKAENQANTTAQNPSAVTDLVATLNSPLAVSWSAPDPGSFNTASLSYDMRYSATIFNETASASWWSDATQVASSSLPSVGEKGASQSASFDVVHEHGQTLYFALKTKVIHITTFNVVSPQSNVAMVIFPSAIDDNSWAMLGKDQYHTSFAANITGPGIGATISWEFDAGVGNTVSQPVVSADGNIYFGTANGSGELIKLDKNGIKQWEYAANVSIGTPAVLSDETVYFGRIGAGGALAFTALKSDGSKKWDYDDASTVRAVAVSSKGEPHFTYSSGTDKLVVLNTDGSAKTMVSNSGLSTFTPVVLEDGTIIAAKRVSGNQFFNAYSTDGTQLWANELFYTGANGSIQSNPSYDKTTGKTYSAVGHDGGSSFGFRMFVIPSDGSVLNTTIIDSASNGSGATMVSITPTKLLVGLDYSWSNPASGSKLFSLNKSDLSVSWSFQADGKINQQVAVDKDGNTYFSTQSGHIYSVDPEGQVRWHILTGIDSVVSPILTENAVIWGYGNRVIGIK